MIEAGDDLGKLFQAMAIEPATNGARLEVFKLLLTRYRDIIQSTILLAEARVKSATGEGPRLGRLAELDYPPPDGKYDFLQKNAIGPGQGHKSTLKTDIQYINTPPAWRDENGNRVARILSVNELSLHKSIHTLIPGFALWAVRSHFRQAELGGCFRKLEVPFVQIKQPASKRGFAPKKDRVGFVSSGLDVELELWVNYVDETGRRKKVVVQRLSGAFEAQGSYHDPKWGEALIVSLWSGGGAGGFKPASASFPDWLKINPLSDTEKAERSQFEQFYLRELRLRQNLVSSDVEPAVRSWNNESKDARRALLFLLEYGLSSHSERVHALYDWLSDPTSLPDSRSWAMGMVDSGATEDEVRGELQDRYATGRKLIDALPASGLLSGPNLFGREILKLRALQVSTKAR